MTDRHSPESGRKYPAPFSLRLSEDERSELNELARGRPVGQFIKDALFDKKLRPTSDRIKPPLLDQKLLAQILGMLGKSRIPQNINQLAKAANSGSLPVNAEVLKSLQEAVRAIEWMRRTLIAGMGLKPLGSTRPEKQDDPQR